MPTPWIPAVTGIADGQDVSSATITPVFNQHTQRAQHLYERLQALQNQSVLVAFDQPILPSALGDVAPAKIVYYAQEVSGPTTTEGLDLAKVDFINLSTHTSAFSSANSNYIFGLVKSVNGTVADVYISGLVTLEDNIDDPTDGLLESSDISPDTSFEPGPMYLSRSEAGKLTRSPGGVAVYIGYALNRTTLLLAPNVSEFNQFFTAYKYNLLDRPVGKPVLSTTWSITNLPEGSGNLQRQIGWVPVADLPASYIPLIPAGAKFFYNIPSDDDISIDTGISSDDRHEQTELGKTLPPSPPSLTILTVNGIVQADTSMDSDGTYTVTELGVWWCDDEENFQPWANDISANITCSIAGDVFETTDAHSFELDDVIQFESAPTGASTATNYWIYSIPDNTHFTISTSSSEDTNQAQLTGLSGTADIAQPYIWKFARGTTEERPRIVLQFVKFNPSIKSAVVTSLKKYNLGSEVISFHSPDKIVEASSGDLLVRILLNFYSPTPLSSSASAITGLSYNEITGIITADTAPMVSELTGINGVTITPKLINGSPKPGSYLISQGRTGTSGRVSDIEPDGVELLYSGLHSYLAMTIPSVQPSSIIGKFTLDQSIPNTDLSFLVFLHGESSSSGQVSFDFSYSVSTVGSVIGATVGPTNFTFNFPVNYVAKTVMKIGNGLTASTFVIPISTLSIPASAITGGDVTINFKLERKAAAYSAAVNITDIYWKVS